MIEWLAEGKTNNQKTCDQTEVKLLGRKFLIEESQKESTTNFEEVPNGISEITHLLRTNLLNKLFS